MADFLLLSSINLKIAPRNNFLVAQDLIRVADLLNAQYINRVGFVLFMKKDDGTKRYL